MDLRTLDDLHATCKSSPEVKDLENEKFDRSFKMLLITEKSGEDIRNGIESISEIDTVEVTCVYGQHAAASVEAQPPAPVPPPPPPPPVQASAPRPAAPAAQSPTAAPRATPVAAPTFRRPIITDQQQAPMPPQSSPQSTEEDDEEKTKEVIELVQLVTFTMAGETYALEIQQVEAIINLVPITRVPKAPPYIDGVINLRGEIVPVINTRNRLRLAPAEKKASNQIIILSFDEEKVKAGFLVDSVQEVIRLTESSIEAPTRVSESVDIEYLRGVGKIDNKIIILLNAHRIVFGKTAEE
jgi:purine-binding chemotaxis protein CheW